MRARAAQYLRENRDDVAPFLANDDGEPLKKAQFDAYCEKVWLVWFSEEEPMFRYSHHQLVVEPGVVNPRSEPYPLHWDEGLR